MSYDDPEDQWQPAETPLSHYKNGSLGAILEKNRVQIEKENKLERLLMRGVTQGNHPEYCNDYESCQQCVFKCELWNE